VHTSTNAAPAGTAANGGRRECFVRGKLRGGFSLLAYPALYGVNGVMTFMVNHDRVVWQRDFGEETPRVTPALERFDPDESWTPLAPESTRGAVVAKPVQSLAIRISTLP
jgi:hypothetical protein